ncbi:MAG: CaiB/BaiF CoA transferase family protein [bacterium]
MRPRVLDLTDPSMLYATRLLADLGADVIRVESAGSVDLAVTVDPATAEDPQDVIHEYFNAGKRSVAVDLRRNEGREILARLCAGVDLVIDGVEPVIEGVEATYARACDANPRLTWVAVRGFEPDADGGFKSTEIVRCALSGLMSITGDPGGPPMLIGGGLSNAVVATYAALAGFLGLASARKTGRGRLVRVSAHDALLSVMQQGLLEASVGGRVVKRAGSRHAHIAVAGALPCRDGHVVVSASAQGIWGALVDTVGDKRLRGEELASESARMRRQDEIFRVLAEWAAPFSKVEISRVAQARRVPVAPVHDMLDLLSDRHLRTRGFFRHLGGEGDMPHLRTPLGEGMGRAPRCGEHTGAVLSEIGLEPAEIAALEAQGVVTQARREATGAARG